MDKKERIEIEIKQKKKGIAAMRQDNSKIGQCRNCYYYIYKRTKTQTPKKRNDDEDPSTILPELPRKEEVVISDYCSCYKMQAKEAKAHCHGQWIYEHE